MLQSMRLNAIGSNERSRVFPAPLLLSPVLFLVILQPLHLDLIRHFPPRLQPFDDFYV
jgi:hypothetical protein